MDANEIIEYAQKSLKDTERFINSIAPYGYGVGGYSKEDDFWRSIIRELSRSRIRVTAEEKPTREDRLGCLCALDDMGCWNFKKWYEIADCPLTYVLWFVMPDVRLPEVTPLQEVTVHD